MKKLIIIVTTLILSIAGTAQADSYLGPKGLFFGAGSGAWVGHTFGRSPEAVAAGAIIGGMTGLIVGSELDRQIEHKQRYHDPHFRPDFHYEPHPPHPHEYHPPVVYKPHPREPVHYDPHPPVRMYHDPHPYDRRHFPGDHRVVHRDHW